MSDTVFIVRHAPTDERQDIIGVFTDLERARSFATSPNLGRDPGSVWVETWALDYPGMAGQRFKRLHAAYAHLDLNGAWSVEGPFLRDVDESTVPGKVVAYYRNCRESHCAYAETAEEAMDLAQKEIEKRAAGSTP